MSATAVCVYCRSDLHGQNTTVDHVIARSWYPADTPPEQKWQVPACRECNNRFSLLERNVLLRLAMCLDGSDPAIAPIVAAAMRSIDPTAAKNSRDKRSRSAAREAIKRELREMPGPNVPGVLPWFVGNFDQGSSLGIQIPAVDLHEVIRKWTRGLHYAEIGKVVPEGYEVDAHIISDEAAERAFADIVNHARLVKRGPGVVALIWHAQEENSFATLFAFQIWKTVRAYGSVLMP